MHHDYDGKSPKRLGLSHPSIAPYGAYTCKRGEQIVISVQNRREWKNFCERVLERPDLVQDSLYSTNVDRCANRDLLDSEIDGVFSAIVREDLAERLLAAQIAFASVNSVAGLSSHRQLRRVEVATPSGKVSMVSPPLVIQGESTVPPRRELWRVPRTYPSGLLFGMTQISLVLTRLAIAGSDPYPCVSRAIVSRAITGPPISLP